MGPLSSGLCAPFPRAADSCNRYLCKSQLRIFCIHCEPLTWSGKRAAVNRHATRGGFSERVRGTALAASSIPDHRHPEPGKHFRGITRKDGVEPAAVPNQDLHRAPCADCGEYRMGVDCRTCVRSGPERIGPGLPARRIKACCAAGAGQVRTGEVPSSCAAAAGSSETRGRKGDFFEKNLTIRRDV